MGIEAALAAISLREETGTGQHIDMALLDVTAASMANQALNFLVSGTAPGRMGNAPPNIVPYQVFETRDGHLIVAVGNDRQFAALCHLIGTPELAQDSRFSTNPARLENRELLIDLLKPIIAGYAKDELLEIMIENGVPGGPIWP